MILNLFQLYRKNGYSHRSPLEDFNTEVFAGILRIEETILAEFITFLKLPWDRYQVITQQRFTLTDRPDCIIDMVLLGQNNVCFIENKVHSGEGWEQLDRYCEALDSHFQEKCKHLIYCTKFTDTKSETRHGFRQIRWFQIAALIRKQSEGNPYLQNYLNFLKHFNMAQKNTFTPEMILSMENARETMEAIKLHIENARPHFNEIFGVKSKFQEAALDGKDRIAAYTEGVLPTDRPHTELLYSIKISSVKLQTQIFINKSHSQLELLKEKIKNFNSSDVWKELRFREHPEGFVIYQERKIYDLLNDPEADGKIKVWFIQSFESFAEFIKATPDLQWSLFPKEVVETV